MKSLQSIRHTVLKSRSDCYIYFHTLSLSFFVICILFIVTEIKYLQTVHSYAELQSFMSASIFPHNEILVA